MQFSVTFLIHVQHRLSIVKKQIERFLFFLGPICIGAFLIWNLIATDRQNSEQRRFGRWEMFQNNVQNNCQIQFFIQTGDHQIPFENFYLLGKKSRFEQSPSDFKLKSMSAVQRVIQSVCQRSLLSPVEMSQLLVQSQCELHGEWIKTISPESACHE